MQDIRYKRCNSNEHIKSGYIRGNQRYKCKLCECNFKIGDNHGKISPQAKALRMLMYGITGMKFSKTFSYLSLIEHSQINKKNTLLHL